MNLGPGFALLPDHLLLATVLLLMVLEMLRADTGLARALFLAATLAAGAVAFWQLVVGVRGEAIAGELRVDALALQAKIVLLGLAALFALLFSGSGYKFWLLLAASLYGALLVAGAAGFATLFIGIEMLSLPAFALIVHGQGRSAAAEGAFKYLVMSSVGTAMLLFGLSLGYGATGSLALAPFAGALGAGGGAATAAGLLAVAGLAVKAAVFPFHAWAPDAYAAAPAPVTAAMAALVKAGVIVALLRITGSAALAPALAAVAMALAIVSILAGNLAALGQLRLKRLIAYSSVAHAGYMLFALADTTGQRSADLLVYVAVYGLGTLVAFAAHARLVGDSDDDSLALLDGRFAARPGAALALAAALLSLAGLPPFPGFFAKLLVFRSAIASDHLLPAVLAFVGSFIGLGVYVGAALRAFRGVALKEETNP
jgi:NADH-quinone oxidoreductase subunit N